MVRKKSHRVVLSRKYKIAKKIREHQRKSRRADKKKQFKREKEPGIPNAYPFKQQILNHVEQLKKSLESNEQPKTSGKRSKKEQAELDAIEDAELRNLKEIGQFVRSRYQTLRDFRRKTAFQLLQYKISISDVILYLLDARDPIGSRCIPIEQLVSQNTKKQVICVLTKIDLIPSEKLEGWYNYLSNFYPVVALKLPIIRQEMSERQFLSDMERELNPQRYKLHMMSVRKFSAVELIEQEAKYSRGLDSLWSLLRQYSKAMDKEITISVVGFHGVGKKTLIKSLLQHAKIVQNNPLLLSDPSEGALFSVVNLDKGLKLLCAPGDIYPPHGKKLRTHISLKSVSHPEKIVEEIIKVVPTDTLLVKYKIPKFSNCEEFLQHIINFKMKKRDLTGQGYSPAAAAEIIIQDWNSGHFSYYHEIPEDPPLGNPNPRPLPDVSQYPVDEREVYKISESDDDDDDDDDDEDEDEDEEVEDDEDASDDEEEKSTKVKNAPHDQKTDEQESKLNFGRFDLKKFSNNHIQKVLNNFPTLTHEDFIVFHKKKPIHWSTIKDFQVTVDRAAKLNEEINPFHFEDTKKEKKKRTLKEKAKQNQTTSTSTSTSPNKRRKTTQSGQHDSIDSTQGTHTDLCNDSYDFATDFKIANGD